MKFTMFVRNIITSDRFATAFTEHLTDADGDPIAPGQIRQRGDWYFLTYLKVTKVRNFDLDSWGLEESEISSTRAVAFKREPSRLLINGGRSEIKEIAEMFNALALKASGNDEEEKKGEFQIDQFYKMDTPEIDLGKILTAMEEKGIIENVKRVRIKPMEVSLGKINNCLINTTDYGAVRKLLTNAENKAFGIELLLRNPEKTTVYFDLEGQVRVSSTCEEIDDVESLAIGYSEYL